MYRFGHFGGGPYWPAVVGSALFWAALAVAIVALVRYLIRRDRPWTAPALHTAQPGPYAPPAVPPAAGILAERFARGEIDEHEYQHRMAVLHGQAPGPAAPPGPGA